MQNSTFPSVEWIFDGAFDGDVVAAFGILTKTPLKRTTCLSEIATFCSFLKYVTFKKSLQSWNPPRFFVELKLANNWNCSPFRVLWYNFWYYWTKITPLISRPSRLFPDSSALPDQSRFNSTNLSKSGGGHPDFSRTSWLPDPVLEHTPADQNS